MIRTLTVIMSAYVLFFSHFLYAAGSGWTKSGNIAELIPTARHYYEFRLPVKNNSSGCRKTDWFYQDYSTQGSEHMFKTLLEAMSSSLQVRVYVTGVCNINGYSEISSVSISP